MTTIWSSNELALIDAAHELHIASKRPDGTLRRWVPIWVVTVDDQVFVRTWFRRDSGWFRHVLESHRAHIRVPDLEIAVRVEDVGSGAIELRGGIDSGYRAKYGPHGGTDDMLTAEAAATTLRLVPDRPPSAGVAGAGELV